MDTLWYGFRANHTVSITDPMSVVSGRGDGFYITTECVIRDMKDNYVLTPSGNNELNKIHLICVYFKPSHYQENKVIY